MVWRTIGAYSGFLDRTTSGGSDQATRDRHSDLVYKEFAKAMGLKEWDGEKMTDEFTVAAIVRGLRDVLGTEEIGQLRREVLNRAVEEFGPAVKNARLDRSKAGAISG
jgi:hypothetical protein